ncbi:Fatty acid desaturase [Paraburkholderia unamae]|uniref:fatty acid desaturase n=1 Tax=Paraburkholderia unamae TaxID=219649 RepID=UPI001CAEA8CA|nr:fatty acid desaturase [Paraburkholderia unamae]CAG9274507.1 Fatty acid desaturase [Paraburkholderia unamae]
MESMSAERAARSPSATRAPRPAEAARANAVLIAFVLAALGYELIGLPLLIDATGGPTLALLATLVPVVLATPAHWGLIHEGIHGQLSRERRPNEWLARALAIGLAMPFDAVRFGHLMHHRFTREPFDRPDVHEIHDGHDARTGSGASWRRRIAYYARLLGGLYVAELLLPLVAFLPVRLARKIVARGVGAHGREGVQVQRLFANHAADPVRRRRARRDWLVSVALYAASFVLYGKAWPVLLATMYLRGVWLSVADNLPHYGVALDEPGRARDFRVPRVLGVLLMNHHLHRQHHLHPTLPWTALPALVQAHQEAASADYLAAALRQFRGLQPGVGTE